MKILIADRLMKVRYAISILLQENTDWTVCDTVNNADDLLIKIKLHKPDVLLIDWHLLEPFPGELKSNIQRTSPGAKIIVMSVDPQVASWARSIGVNNFVSKTYPAKKLIGAIQNSEQSSIQDTKLNTTGQVNSLNE